MSQFDIEQVVTDIAPEVTVNNEGKGTISGRGLARLLGVSASTVTRSGFPQKLAERLTERGFDPDRFFSKNGFSPAQFPDASIPIIAAYFAYNSKQPSKQAEDVLLSGSAVFFRQLFQKVKGWQPESKLMTKDEALKALVQEVQSLIAIHNYASDKPGQEHINAFAIGQGGQKALPGLITLEDVLNGREFTQGEKSMIGRIAASNYRSLTGKEPEKTRVKVKGKEGKLVWHTVSAYPLDFLPVIENAIELGFGSSH
jgi:hypothetical protein